MLLSAFLGFMAHIIYVEISAHMHKKKVDIELPVPGDKYIYKYDIGNPFNTFFFTVIEVRNGFVLCKYKDSELNSYTYQLDSFLAKFAIVEEWNGEKNVT